MDLNLASLNSKIFDTVGRHYISYQDGVLSQDDINNLITTVELPVIAPNQRFRVEAIYRPIITPNQRFKVEKE